MEGGTKFVFKISLQPKAAGGSRVNETKKTHKTKSDPDKYTDPDKLNMGQALKRAN